MRDFDPNCVARFRSPTRGLVPTPLLPRPVHLPDVPGAVVGSSLVVRYKTAVSTRASLADHAAQGLAAGALFGGLDVLLVHLYAPGVHAPGWLLLAWITVGLFGTAAGFALGAALRLVAGRRADWRGFELSTLGALLAVYGLVLLVINIHVLRVLPGDLLSAPVLGANAAIAAALAASIRLARARTQSGRSVLLAS
jgi:MFS family permease